MTNFLSNLLRDSLPGIRFLLLLVFFFLLVPCFSLLDLRSSDGPAAASAGFTFRAASGASNPKFNPPGLVTLPLPPGLNTYPPSRYELVNLPMAPDPAPHTPDSELGPPARAPPPPQKTS